MSTKIYDAYKYKRDASTLMEYLIAYRKKWLDYHVGRLSDIMEDAYFNKESSLYKEFFGDSEGKFNYPRFAERLKLDSRKEFKSFGDAFDISGEIAIFFHKKNIYVQTFLNDRDAPKFVNKDMIDYHYQNQTDPWYEYQIDAGKMKKSEKAKWAKDYKERKKVWDGIYHNDTVSCAAHAGMLYSYGVEFSDYHYVSIKVYKNWCRLHDPTAGILKER